MSACVIYKFDLAPPNDTTRVMLPRGATVVHFAEQHGLLRMWVELPIAMRDDVPTPEPRHFVVFPTGQPYAADRYDYIATTFSQGGMFVWHLFEVRQP